MRNDIPLIELPQLEFALPDSTLPQPDDVNFYVLVKERKIYLDFEVNENVLAIQRFILRWNMEDKDKEIEDRVPIKLYIMSYGGDIDYMWSIVDTINTSVTPVYTYNMGVAASAASIIFMSGNKRFMMPNAKVVIHEGSASMSGDAIKVLDASDSYKKTLKKMKEYILSKTSIPQAALNKKRNNDWELDSEYCLANGVCDAVISSLSEIL